MNPLRLIVLAAISCSCLVSCDSPEGNPQLSDGLEPFKRGVELSLKSESLYSEGDIDAANKLNNQANNFFDEALKLDPSYFAAAGAKAHAHFLLREFKECVIWYDNALSLDSNLVPYYYERGICLVQSGNIPKGISSIEQAVDKGNPNEILEMASLDLSEIATLAFQLGDTLADQGQFKKGNGYQRYAIGVLMSAHNLDTTNMAAANQIAQMTRLLGDTVTANRFDKISNP
ncbi:MAG: tetratricopeptide (TPR) repeat protein [Litorivivens sp.]|jgi:tetratricopeptide (TPR) repeat protein